MPGSPAFVPIIIAVIGVIGAIVPIYVSTVPMPELFIDMFRFSQSGIVTDPNTSEAHIFLRNDGNSPATNLSVALRAHTLDETANIFGITNDFSGTEIVYNNTVLEPGFTQAINQSLLKIQVLKLVPGLGSMIKLRALSHDSESLDLNAVYDQGSDSVSLIGNETFNTTEERTEIAPVLDALLLVLNPVLLAYYAIFFGLIYLYFRRRKRMKRFPTRIAKDIMETRGVLRNDLTTKDIFSETWFNMSDKERKTINNIGDYLLIDDFYQDLRRRNSYLSRNIDKEESNLSRANNLSRLNGALLAAAENALNKIDWNKYR